MENSSMENREELKKELLNNLQELEVLEQLENLIKDNKIEFNVNNKVYRVRLPNWDETETANKEKIRKFQEMLEAKDDKGKPQYRFKEYWIKLLKLQGEEYDIDKITSKINMINQQMDNLKLKLAQTKNEDGITNLKNEILQMKYDVATLSMKKTDLMKFSLEDQLLYHCNSYITYLVLEEKLEDKWNRVFDNYDNFKNSQNVELLQKALFFMDCLIYRDQE